MKIKYNSKDLINNLEHKLAILKKAQVLFHKKYIDENRLKAGSGKWIWKRTKDETDEEVRKRLSGEISRVWDDPFDVIRWRMEEIQKIIRMIESAVGCQSMPDIVIELTENEIEEIRRADFHINKYNFHINKYQCTSPE